MNSAYQKFKKKRLKINGLKQNSAEKNVPARRGNDPMGSKWFGLKALGDKESLFPNGEFSSPVEPRLMPFQG